MWICEKYKLVFANLEFSYSEWIAIILFSAFVVYDLIYVALAFINIRHAGKFTEYIGKPFNVWTFMYFIVVLAFTIISESICS